MEKKMFWKIMIGILSLNILYFVMCTLPWVLIVKGKKKSFLSFWIRETSKILSAYWILILKLLLEAVSFKDRALLIFLAFPCFYAFIMINVLLALILPLEEYTKVLNSFFNVVN